jgi:formyltetrahydrofolate hydrolase
MPLAMEQRRPDHRAGHRQGLARDKVGDLARIGRDLERLVLVRAVRANLEERVPVDGERGVFF